MMIYDFAAKIKGIKGDMVFSMESLDESVLYIGKNVKKPLEIQVVVPDEMPVKYIYIKTEVSISSMPKFHELELEEAIGTFKDYLEELAKVLDGEVSKSDAFYINRKTFSRLYS